MAFSFANKVMADYPHLLIRTRVTCDATDATSSAQSADHGGPTDVTPLATWYNVTTKIATATMPEINYDETNGEVDVKLNHSSPNGLVFDIFTLWPTDVSKDGESLDNF